MPSRMIAMIPARLGSQRLKQKNLREIEGKPLIGHAIEKCIQSNVFDEVVLNSENPIFQDIADEYGARFHLRPEVLGNNVATSEQYIAEFLETNECDRLIQVHSIAPLLTQDEIERFTKRFSESDFDVLLSVTLEQIECFFKKQPLNFTFANKTNSQELPPVERVTWSITGWKRSKFLEAARSGRCATYHGHIGTFPVDRMAGHIIKTEEDLQIAQALWSSRFSNT